MASSDQSDWSSSEETGYLAIITVQKSINTGHT